LKQKNQLESYLYSLRSSCEDTLKSVISDGDKEKLLATVKDALDWLEIHPTDEKESYDDKRKEVEAIANPILTNAYQQKGATASTTEDASPASAEYSGNTDSSSSTPEPTVEEVDDD